MSLHAIGDQLLAHAAQRPAEFQRGHHFGPAAMEELHVVGQIIRFIDMAADHQHRPMQFRLDAAVTSATLLPHSPEAVAALFWASAGPVRAAGGAATSRPMASGVGFFAVMRGILVAWRAPVKCEVQRPIDL